MVAQHQHRQRQDYCSANIIARFREPFDRTTMPQPGF
jgi:hypothetical protein